MLTMQPKAEPAKDGYQYIIKTELKYDINILDAALSKIEDLFDERNQICVTCRKGIPDPLYAGIGRLEQGILEKEYNQITPLFQGTIFEQILYDLNIQWGRARLMRLNPQHTMFMHPDMGTRYHIAIRTNPNSFIFFKDTLTSYHIPVDGYVYKMDATKWHTAFNAGKRVRHHFVIADGNCFDEYTPY